MWYAVWVRSGQEDRILELCKTFRHYHPDAYEECFIPTYEKYRKVKGQEFYDMVVSDEAYAMLIQWVTDHQSEERKYSKKEIYEAYREYLEEIYKYNLSDGTESSR